MTTTTSCSETITSYIDWHNDFNRADAEVSCTRIKRDNAVDSLVLRKLDNTRQVDTEAGLLAH